MAALATPPSPGIASELGLSPNMTVKAPVVSPPSLPDSSIATPSLWDTALGMAQDSLNAQVQPLQDQIAANNAQEQVAAQAATADAAAAADMLKQIAPAISALYGNAVNETGTLAKGFSTDFQTAVDQAGSNVNDVLAKIGAPAGQMVDPTKAADAANVLYGLGGFIPGQEFAKEGAAAAGAAAVLPGVATLTGLQNAQKAYTDNVAANQKIEDNIATLAGKLPGDAMTNYKDLSNLALNDSKFAEQLRHNRVTEQQATERIATSQFTARTNAYYKGVSATQAAQRIALDSAKFARSQFQQDRMYKIALAHLGISQEKAASSIAANEFKLQHGGYTQAKISGFNTKLDAFVARVPPGTPYDAFLRAAITGHVTITAKNGTQKTINVGTSGVPVSLIIARANSLYPETQRATPGELGGLMQLPQVAQNWKAQLSDYAQTTGQVLGTSQKNGAAITWSVPTNLSAKGKAQVGGVLSLAQEYLGTPYAWGGESPTGFDCSGLAQYIYAKEGVQIPRTTYDQFQSGLNVPRGQLQAGDLVFFKGGDSIVRNGQTLPGHVGIYIGNGLMIQAPHTGDVVQVSKLNSVGGFMGARRYVR